MVQVLLQSSQFRHFDFPTQFLFFLCRVVPTAGRRSSTTDRTSPTCFSARVTHLSCRLGLRCFFSLLLTPLSPSPTLCSQVCHVDSVDFSVVSRPSRNWRTTRLAASSAVAIFRAGFLAARRSRSRTTFHTATRARSGLRWQAFADIIRQIAIIVRVGATTARFVCVC